MRKLQRPFRLGLIGVGVLFISALGWTARPAAIELPPAASFAGTEASTTARSPSGGQLAFDLYRPQIRKADSPNSGYSANVFLPNRNAANQILVNKVPQVKVDPSGGVHAVYTSNYPDDGNVRGAYYAYCASDCTSSAGFAAIRLSNNVQSAQLALDPDGHPHLLLATLDQTVFGAPVHYEYGECSSTCTDRANWTLTTVAVAQPSIAAPAVESSHSFALDPSGHPRFVFYGNPSGAAAGQPAGTVYAYCDSNCTDAAAWQASNLAADEWTAVALAFTSGGLPRLAFKHYAGDPFVDGAWVTAYAECDATCANWTGTDLASEPNVSRAEPVVFALRLDTNDNPRIAYFSGLGNGGSLAAGHLFYLSCDSACGQASANWSAIRVNLSEAVNGTRVYNGASGLDLALDTRDRPRIAYHIGWGLDELGYSWCNSACETDGSAWSSQVIWSAAATTAEMGLPPREGCPSCIPPIPPCPLGFWDAGYWPSLTLDAAGNPRIAYEAQLYNGGGACRVNQWARLSRFVAFDQP